MHQLYIFVFISVILLYQISSEQHVRFAVLTRARKESAYSSSFIEWYLALGFEKILIIQNDHGPIISYNSKSVEVIRDTRNIEPDEIFTDYFAKISAAKFDWLLLIDMDEYLVLNETFANNSISQFVQKIESENKRIFEVIQFRWALAEVVDPIGLPIDVYTYFQNSKLYKNHNVKSMFRVAETYSIRGPHTPALNDENNISVYYDGSITNEIWPVQEVESNSYEQSILLHFHTRSIMNLITKSLVTSLKFKKISKDKERPLLRFFQSTIDSISLENFTSIIGVKADLPLVHSSEYSHITEINFSSYLRTKQVYLPICNQTLEREVFTQAICNLYSPRQSWSFCSSIVRKFTFEIGPYLTQAYKAKGVQYIK